MSLNDRHFKDHAISQSKNIYIIYTASESNANEFRSNAISYR